MATYLPFSDVVAAYGYRQPPPARQRGTVLPLALAYMVMGCALGTVAGTGLAMATLHPGNPTLVFQDAPPVQANAIVDHIATAAPQLTATAQPAVLTSHAASKPANFTKPSPIKTAKAGIQVTPDQIHAQRSNEKFKAIAPPVVRAEIATVPNVTPSQVQAGAPQLPAVVSTGTVNYKFYSEGDVTVADFNAITGTIESYEGRTFVIGASAAASVASAFQDSGSSVHYRCDQSGNCTLMRAGLVMQNVRLL
jgi:hypothetical protein